MAGITGALNSPRIRDVHFLGVQKDQVTNSIVEDGDLFIGENKSVTIRLPYDETFQLGDVVVLGELIVHPSEKDCNFTMHDIAENVKQAASAEFLNRNLDQYRLDHT